VDTSAVDDTVVVVAAADVVVVVVVVAVESSDTAAAADDDADGDDVRYDIYAAPYVLERLHRLLHRSSCFYYFQ